MGKTYVIFRGRKTGVFNKPWAEVRRLVNGDNSDFKSYDSKWEAYADWDKHVRQRSLLINTPKPTANALFIDSVSCRDTRDSRFQIWDVAAGEAIHTSPVYEESSINIVDFIGIASALRLCQSAGYSCEIYSDNTCAISWIRSKAARSKVHPTANDRSAFEELWDANNWLATANKSNVVRQWHTEVWGRPCEVLRL
jgi:ribonuclease HI